MLSKFNWVSRLQGWRACAASFVSGALITFAYAPFDFWPLIFLCLPVFFLLLESATTVRESTLRGFCFGYGFFMAGTWWIANALLVDADKFAWLMPFSVLGLSAVMAWSFAVLGWWVFRARVANPLHNLLRFAVLWVVVEYLRSTGMFGFPWNLVGYISLSSIQVAQFASIVGTFGMGFVVVLLGLSPLALRQWSMARTLMVVVVSMATLWACGAWRLPESIALTKTTLRIVQPSIPQSFKSNPAMRNEVLTTLVQLSHAASPKAVNAIIWPESALPGVLWQDVAIRNAHFENLTMPAPLLTGAVTASNSQPQLQMWNSLVAISPDGMLMGRYSKHQLVPFGEFVPLRALLPIDKITPGGVDFSRGPGPQTLTIAGVPSFSPLVCYEAIFPWLAVESLHRPRWLLNVTNDGWYGDTPGPYQHFAMSRMRAIEQGLPMVRAANNGISAMIDPYGQVRETLPLNARAIIDAPLPESLTPTWYGRFHELGALLLLTIAWLLTLLPRLHPKKITIC